MGGGAVLSTAAKLDSQETGNLATKEEASSRGRVERALAWFSRRIWIGKYPEPEPRKWTAEETQAAWNNGEIPPPEFPDTRFGRFDRRWTAFTKWWSYLAGIGLLFVVLILVIDVVGWKFAGSPFPNAQDLVKYMNVVAVFFAVAFIQTDRGSTAIELLQKSFGPRIKLVIRTLAWVLGMAACFYCAYRGGYLTHEQVVKIKRSSAPLKFLVWPFSAAMVIGFILLGVSFVVTGIRDIIEFKDRRARYGRMRRKVVKTVTDSTVTD